MRLLRWAAPAATGSTAVAPAPATTIMVTAGEDCFIRLSVLSTDGSLHGKPVSIKGDSSSVRTLAISGSVLFSAGGKGMVKCWRLSMEGGVEPLAAPLVEWPVEIRP